MSDGDVIRSGSSDLARENPFIVTRFDLTHQIVVAEPNNYLYSRDDADIGLRDSDDNGVPDLAYVTGTGAFDRITLTRHATDPNIVLVTVAAHSNATFTSLIQQETYNINLLTDTEGTVLIDSSLSNDLIEIDADIAADFRIRGMVGNDQVRLRGDGASVVRSFIFEGEAGNDTFTIDYQNGDPLPIPGFDFNFIGGAGTDNTTVVEIGGTQRTGYFVNTNTDATDISVGNGRADSSAATDDQTTLRSAVQEANASTNRTYIFVPAGTYTLSLSGTGADTQGDLDVTRNVMIIGTGAGQSIIDAGGSSGINDRVFEVNPGGALTLSRLTVTGGDSSTSGGGIRVNGTTSAASLTLEDSAVVGNTATAVAGGVYNNGANASTTISRSVIAYNHAANSGESNIHGGAVYATAGALSIGNSIIANNTADTLDSDGAADLWGNASNITSLGNNRLENVRASLLSDFTVGDDFIGAVDHVVTGVADTYSHADDSVVLSIRDAIDLANEEPDTSTIWFTAWNFVLTRERNWATHPTDMDVSIGDLDVHETLIVRGVTNATSVAWRAGLAADAVFDLLGDYNGDGITTSDNGKVSAADYTIWQDTLNSTTDLRADGNDDGIVDDDDYDVWIEHYNHKLTLLNIA